MWVSTKRYQTESHHLEGLMERVLEVKFKGEVLPALLRPVKALPSHVASKVKPEKEGSIHNVKICMIRSGARAL